MNITIETPDIRDIAFGETYFVITNPDGRMVKHPRSPMFPACFRDRKEAKSIAESLGTGHTVVKQFKNHP